MIMNKIFTSAQEGYPEAGRNFYAAIYFNLSKMTRMIIEQTYNLLKSRYIEQIEKLKISDVRIGMYLTAVRLSDNSFGTSATIADEHPFCAKSNRDFGDFTPLKIRGQKVLDILETKKETSILSSLRIAVLNAISSKIISSGNYRIIEDSRSYTTG